MVGGREELKERRIQPVVVLALVSDKCGMRPGSARTPDNTHRGRILKIGLLGIPVRTPDGGPRHSCPESYLARKNTKKSPKIAKNVRGVSGAVSLYMAPVWAFLALVYAAQAHPDRFVRRERGKRPFHHAKVQNATRSPRSNSYTTSFRGAQFH